MKENKFNNRIKEELIKNIKIFIENSNNKNYNKNFILYQDYFELIKNLEFIKDIPLIEYKNLPKFIENNKDKLCIVYNVDEQHSIRNSYVLNCINFKYLNKKNINNNFIILTKKNLYIYSNNSILFF